MSHLLAGFDRPPVRESDDARLGRAVKRVCALYDFTARISDEIAAGNAPLARVESALGRHPSLPVRAFVDEIVADRDRAAATARDLLVRLREDLRGDAWIRGLYEGGRSLADLFKVRRPGEPVPEALEKFDRFMRRDRRAD